MTFKELKKHIKEQQKELAKQISRGKYLRKPENRTDVTDEDKKLFFYGQWFENFRVHLLGQKYRHIHLAYCQFFNGTQYGRIELVTRLDNKPNKEKIESYIEAWKDTIAEEEPVCEEQVAA